MMPRYTALAAAWALMHVTVTAEPTNFHESLTGNWVLETCEHNGHMRKSITLIRGVEFTRDLLQIRNAAGKTTAYTYRLGKDKAGYVVDLFRQSGEKKGTLIPSRLSFADGKLLLMLPAYSRLPERRPDSLESSGNGEWIVLHLTKSVPSELYEIDE